LHSAYFWYESEHIFVTVSLRDGKSRLKAVSQ